MLGFVTSSSVTLGKKYLFPVIPENADYRQPFGCVHIIHPYVVLRCDTPGFLNTPQKKRSRRFKSGNRRGQSNVQMFENISNF